MNAATQEPHYDLIDRPWFAWIVFLGLMAAVILLWLFLPGCLVKNLTGPADAGEFGDTFGSVNALFTGLAFAGIVFTILLQQRQIKLQRLDFTAQLKEMQQSREEVEQQNRLLGLQLKVQCLEITARAFSFEGEAENLLSNVTVTDQLQERARDLQNRAHRLTQQVEFLKAQI